MKFITFTTVDDKIIYVNASEIEAFRDDNEYGAHLFMKSETEFDVKDDIKCVIDYIGLAYEKS